MELSEKLEGVREIAEGVAPQWLVALALARMEEGHRGNELRGEEAQVWEDVAHLDEATDEAADWVNYVSGLVATGKVTAENGRGVVEAIAEAWTWMMVLVGEGPWSRMRYSAFRRRRWGRRDGDGSYPLPPP